MTYLKDPFGRDLFVNFDKVWVGFEDKIDKMTRVRNELTKNINTAYPPYNIVKMGEQVYAVEIAVAGFSKDDIDIEIDNSRLTIKGNNKNDTGESNYLFKGISNRAFTRTFELDEYIEVRGAEIVNGMLRVILEKVIPESRKSKKLAIQDSVKLPASDKQLLVG